MAWNSWSLRLQSIQLLVMMDLFYNNELKEYDDIKEKTKNPNNE